MYPLKDLVVKQNTKRDLAEKILLEQISPLRLLFFVFLPGIVITQWYIPPESSMMMMDYLPVIAAATIGFIALEEREKLRKLNWRQGIFWIATLSVGVFTVEFLAFFVHALASLFIAEGKLTHEAEFWVTIATIFTGLGGVILGVLYFFSERIDRWIFSKVNEKYARLATAGFVIILCGLSLWMNPQTQNFLHSFP